MDLPAPAGYLRALGAAAAAYAVFHHVGSLPGGLGEVGVTRWADWLDLLTPFAVLLPAAVALRTARSSARVWAVFAVAATAYVQGQGIHLAANSVGNADPGRTAHFWDEIAGHTIWYAGAAAVMGCLAGTMHRFPRPTAWWVAGPALGVGLTWWTNALGGGTTWLGLPVALALATFGWRHRSSLAGVLVVAFAPAVLLFVAWFGLTALT